MNPLSTMRFDLAPPKEPVPTPKVGDVPKKAAAPTAQNTCEAAGGKCLILSPTNCPNGSWADMATHSCGSSDGLGCCMPPKGEAKAAPTTKPAAADAPKVDPTAAVPVVASAPPTATATPTATASATATAAPGDTRDTTGFSAAPEAGADEKFSGSTLLVEAYAAIWLVMMAWLLLLWTKSQSLTARLSGLEAAIDRAEKRAEAKPPAKDRAKEEEKEPAQEAS